MPIDLQQVFATHERSLLVANQRLELLAANLANADTPNYKARDIDFRSAMQEADQGARIAATHAGHIADQANSRPAAPLYRVPDQPSLDGNTVDTQKESAAVAETSTRYQASLTFLSQRIRGLRTAITGGN